jgi:TatD DNase family protein
VIWATFPVPTVHSLVDSHCHLADADFDADRDDALARARAAGVASMLVVGVMDGSGRHRRALDLASANQLGCAVGMHPHEAQLVSEPDYEELAGLARAGRILAVGEIGLDFHYDLSPRDVQEQVFRRQIRLAHDAALPIIIHTREAEAETLKILAEERVPAHGGVVHCFTGSAEMAAAALAMGLFLSFSGIVAFPRAEALRAIAREVPSDRLLIETDAPYLAPPPHRGRRNEPAFVVEVARAVAAARGVGLEQVAASTSDNYARCFRI